MMREGEKTDTIKLYVHLIGKVKRGEEISLSNKMLSTELKNITSGQIRRMLEVESLHHDPCSPQQAQLTEGLPPAQDTTPASPEARVDHLLRLKAHSAVLARAVREGRDEEIQLHSAALLRAITSAEQLRFILQAMFRVRSLTALLAAAPGRLREQHDAQRERRAALYVVALVRATADREEAAAMLRSIGESASIIEEKRRVIGLLGELVRKEKELAGEDETLERSVVGLDKSTRTVIKNSIETECKISISEENPGETFSKINSLDSSLYLHAYPLTQLYFERNPEVVEGVRHTELFKHLVTSKSFIVPESLLNNSYNSAHSRSKSKPRPKKNPNAYEAYLKASAAAAQDCVAVCRQGLLLTKHNYGNLKSSQKFVRVSGESLEYFKSREATDSGTRWNFSEILCVLYGKATARQLDNEEDHAESCFSVVLRDRSLDLSAADEQLPEALAFIRGLASLLGEFRRREQGRAEEEARGLREAKRSRLRELGETARFHEGKVQRLTLGGLLWSQLLLALNSRAGVAVDGRAGKMEGMRWAASRASSESLRRG